MDKLLAKLPPPPGGGGGGITIPGVDWGDCVKDSVATLQCIPTVFQNVINWALVGGGIVALFFIIWSGIKYIRSGGTEDKVKEARETLTYAIIGLVVILLSFAIINFISALTGVSCIKQFGFGNCN
ncbi:MAG: hypothetical protein A2958_01290 [Candidatus Levybacteria bacterium RIFCSPLOWO2_01_FULL_38_13]|nr:MAG: hypothetical protein A2629_01150 [Candidatus Levybacteria bacterium RIFCSPHIGHO2_01_FULL_41_15]OGH35788.1 MAG: hypothetical protein A2958_01290 [Candidatus Levybacteria bacterium RIFCSPLOWO2_01_FULL_38_13]